MEDFFLEVEIDHHRSICISPLPAKTYRETATKGLGGEYGYFIYEVDASRPSAGIEVIGKAASVEAALRIFEIIRASSVDRHQLRETHAGAAEFVR